MKILNYLKYLPWLILIVYIILNQSGCLGKTITKEVEVVRIDTITQVRVDSFIEEIPVPVEKKIYITIDETVDLDSIQTVYFNRINDLQKSIVEYRNAIDSLAHKTPPDKIVITANEYKDTITTDDHTLRVDIGLVGHLEYFRYSLDQYQPKPKCPDCPKIKNNFISLGTEVGFDGESELKGGYGYKFIYGQAGYKLRDEFNIKNFTAELGVLFRF